MKYSALDITFITKTLPFKPQQKHNFILIRVMYVTLTKITPQLHQNQNLVDWGTTTQNHI